MATTRETRDKEKTYREKVAGYWFDLSKIAVTALVVGAITQIFNPEANFVIILLVFLLGIFVSVRFYKIACSFLKE